jgi:hypothetical protein
MLTWHRGLKDDQAYEIFTSLLPDTKPYKAVGKTLLGALRNGLAHKFRPDTIRIDDEDWRFTISSQSEPLISVRKGKPHWIHLSIRAFSSRLLSEIDAYEQELRTSADARLSFDEKSKRYINTLPAEATSIAEALRLILGETHS